MSRTRPQFLCGVVEGFYGRPWTLEQRIDLFSRMSSWGMNTYLYAPKDDDKHRAYWRDLYTLEEADHLSQLIKEADNKGILFIYAIAPGLDVTFSSSEEVTLLKRKLKQVSALGCKSFAVLFDDIDCDMCAADAKEFPSFAHAQVTVTNDLYTHLEHPDVFLFCPTEYCGSRALPSVPESQYLKHIGSDLHPNIDIMWTGPKVISKTIPLSSIEKLTKVLQRAPVMWDNLHANDYDQRRLFLGPYSGRSTTLIPKLSGVLTNPNCEYGANYIPIHTLAQWSKCGMALAKRPSPTKQAMMLEIEGSNNGSTPAGEDGTTPTPTGSSKMADIQQKSDVSLYDPKVALEISIRQWCHEFSVPRRKPEHYKPVKDASSVAMAFDAGDHVVSEQAGEGVLLSPKIKDIDILKDQAGPVTSDPFTLEDLRYLVDYFYLPHLHGERAINLLEEFCWLKENAPGYELLQINDKLKNSSLSDEEEKEVPMATTRERNVASDGMRSDGEASESIPGEEMSRKEVSVWCERAAKFHEVCTCVSEMFSRLTAIPNRALLYDVYQYTWDAKEATMLLDSYIAWLEAGGSEVNPEHEPFVPRGGFVAEMQQLLPQVKGCKKLFGRPGRAPKEPSPVIFTIRPYREEDKELVYQTCLETGSSGQDATQLFTNYPNLLGDRFVGPYTTLSPELSFVVEDSEGVCGYVLAVLDSKAFYHQFKEWLPTVIGNYPAPLPKANEEKLSPEEELIQELHDIKFFLPAKLQRDYPSHLHIDLMKRCQGKGIGTRMIKTILATLKAKGSHGVHLEMAADNLRALKFYHKLGFKVLDFDVDMATGEGLPPDSVLILGRQL